MPKSNIQDLIVSLAADDGITRQTARHDLESMGPAAEEALIDALGHEQDRVRWEAAKALSRIATGRASQALVQRLDDDNHGTRWLAAEALVRTGPDGVEALLVALGQTLDKHGVESEALREGAHHVLHSYKGTAVGDLLGPVVEALLLKGNAAATSVVATTALQKLRSRSS